MLAISHDHADRRFLTPAVNLG